MRWVALQNMSEHYGIPEEDPGWGLVLPLVRDELVYTLGVETGMIWEQLKPRPSHFSSVIHTENIHQVKVMAGRLGYRFRDEASRIDGWSLIWMDLLED